MSLLSRIHTDYETRYEMRCHGLHCTQRERKRQRERARETFAAAAGAEVCVHITHTHTHIWFCAGTLIAERVVEWLGLVTEIVLIWVRIFILVLSFVNFRPFSSNFVLRWKCHHSIIVKIEGFDNPLIFCVLPDKPYPTNSSRQTQHKIYIQNICETVQGCILIICIYEHVVLKTNTQLVS